MEDLGTCGLGGGLTEDAREGQLGPSQSPQEAGPEGGPYNRRVGSDM